MKIKKAATPASMTALKTNRGLRNTRSAIDKLIIALCVLGLAIGNLTEVLQAWALY